MKMCGQGWRIEQIDTSKAVSQQYLSPRVCVDDRVTATTEDTGAVSSIICDFEQPG